MKKVVFVGFMVVICAFLGYAQTAPARFDAGPRKRQQLQIAPCLQSPE